MQNTLTNSVGLTMPLADGKISLLETKKHIFEIFLLFFR